MSQNLNTYSKKSWEKIIAFLQSWLPSASTMILTDFDRYVLLLQAKIIPDA